MKDKYKALIICFIGLISAVIILGSLIGAYTTYEDKKKEIDIGGIVSIIIVSILYWYCFTRVWCVSYNLASMWPRLAFKYGLGGGIFFAIFKMFVSKKHENTDVDEIFEDYLPLLVLSLIFGHYTFLFLEIASMDNHNCLIKISYL